MSARSSGQRRVDDAEVQRERRNRSTAVARAATASRLLPRRVPPAGRRAGWRAEVASSRASTVRSNRAANCSARSTRRLSSANGRRSTTRRRRARQVVLAVERIEDLARQRVARDRVDREIAPPRRIRDRAGSGSPSTENPLWPAPGLRLAPRQRDVDVADLVDREALADRIHPAEPFEQRRAAGPPAARTPRDPDPSARARAGRRGPSRRPAAPGRRAAWTSAAIASARSGGAVAIGGLPGGRLAGRIAAHEPVGPRRGDDAEHAKPADFATVVDLGARRRNAADNEPGDRYRRSAWAPCPSSRGRNRGAWPRGIPCRRRDGVDDGGVDVGAERIRFAGPR